MKITSQDALPNGAYLGETINKWCFNWNALSLLAR